MLDLPALVPRNAAEVLDAVREAAARESPLEIAGQGTKHGYGHAVPARQRLDLSALSGLVLYEPDEIVLTVQAGTPLAEIDAALAAEHQELAFEPMDYGPIYGLPPGGGTIGGALAANLSGPRRIKSGAARDHVLGVKAVSGRGEAFKSGGRVVKNVTGYDMSKALAGSFGTLAVMTELTLKVLPRAEASATLVLRGLDDRSAVDLLCAAMGSPAEVSGAAHLPLAAAGALPALGADAATLIRLEGFRPSVLYRADRLLESVGAGHEIARLDDDASTALWRSIRDVAPFAGSPRALWRISTAPASGPDFAQAIARQYAIRHFFDWSGGLVWIEIADALPDDGAVFIRETVAKYGGHATLVRAAHADSAVRRFHPQEPALAELSARIKAQFDPLNILNPGRMG